MAPEIICKACGQQKKHQAFGLCSTCYMQRWKEQRKDQQAEYHKAYEEKRRGTRVEYTRKKSAESYRRNRDKVLARSKEQYRRNKARRRVVARAWDAAHRQNKQQAWKRWFSRKRANTPIGHGLTVKEWQAIQQAYGYRCAYCGIQGVELTQDHILPVSRGGSDSQDNVVPACRSCNCQKSDKTPEEWGRWPSLSS